MDNRSFLAKRRDRAIATFLSYKEREVDGFLPESIAQDLRKIFLDQFNDVIDLAFDLIGQDSIWNDEFMARLDDIYSKVSGESPEE